MSGILNERFIAEKKAYTSVDFFFNWKFKYLEKTEFSDLFENLLNKNLGEMAFGTQK